MKTMIGAWTAVLALFALTSTKAATLVDNIWPTGVRTNGTTSDWFTTSSANVSAGTGFLSFTNLIGSSEWSTYFTAAGSPVHLNVGDTLTLALTFKINGMGVGGTSSKTFNVGVFDSSAGTRLTTDGAPPCASYTGYVLQNSFAATWLAGPTWYERTNTASTDALKTTADNSKLTPSGAFSSGSQYFTNLGTYTLTLTLTHTNQSQMVMTAAWSGGGLTNTVTDTNVLVLTTNFDTFIVRPTSDNTTATNIIYTEFKVTGPTGSASAPLIVSSPQSLTRETGTYAQFNVSASGGQPLFYHWYSVAGGVTNLVSGQTNSQLQFINVQPGQAANYFSIVSNSLGSATSGPATLTITTPVYTATNLVVDDFWLDGSQNNTPIATNNSVWYASTAGSLSASTGTMTGTADPSSSRTWVGYFANDPSVVDLAVGTALKVTLVFTPITPAPQNNSSLRFGILNFADGATPITADGFGTTNFNVDGYMLTENFGTSFGVDRPMTLFSREVFTDGDLLGTSGDYAVLGTNGPSGETNLPAFASGTSYTLTMTASRTSTTNVNLSTSITGGALNLAWNENDTTNLYRRFDSFAIRANRSTDSAASFNFTEFRVEVITATTTSTPIPLHVQLSGGNVTFTWSNPVFSLYAAPVVTGPYTLISGAATGYSVPATNSQRYFRLFSPN